MSAQNNPDSSEYYSFVNKVKHFIPYNMIRLLVYLQILLLLGIYTCQASHINKVDRDVLHTFWQYATKHQLSRKNINERIPIIACFFLDTPYKSNTLNVTQKELPVINLHELDCVTFVENVLALSLLSEYNDNAIGTFVNNIISLRYRNSEIEDYTTRLHYTSDRLIEMEKQHLLKDITQFAGGICFHPEVCFMSKNYDRYPPLKADLKLLKKIKTIETEINKRTYYYIPKNKINTACNKIKAGDVILITTNIKGLDVSHLGFAYKQQGKTYLLHASSTGKRVMLSEQPLQDYMEGIKSQSGIMVGRITQNIPE